jgi:L-2-hydroxyglutarate oxidase LhgO
MSEHYDIGVIGGGIVGLATARALLAQTPALRILVLEKEPAVASHQTGHNSGVIHQGIYYKPGSLKAELCVRGARWMVEYCARHDIPFERVGKVIVATEDAELPRLQLLYERALANDVPGVINLDRVGLGEIEPHAAGLAALHSPNTAIVDYARVAQALCDEINAGGGRVVTGAPVSAVQTRAAETILITPRSEFRTRFVVNCAGLHADAVARMCGTEPNVRIIPFRGEYYFLTRERNSLVRGLIYPVADPQLPFLGVHFTRTVHGTVEAGPNAVFALAREGYGWTRVSARDTFQTLTFSGFWRMARRWWRTGAFEFYRSLSKPAFVRSLQKLVPDIRSTDLQRGGAGVRAQAVNDRGELLDDFSFIETERALHVLNAPSPAATASLAIGEYIASRVHRG